ncbi:MAG: ROK family protein [Pyrinomonadaceae bacterium]|nr:ROK family protein [Pyrinomonadaceae bacterium]
MSDSAGGSPAIAGIDIGTSGFCSVSVDAGGKVLEARQGKIDRGSDLLPQVIEHVGSLKSDLGGLERIGIAVPGLINRRTNRVEYSAEYPSYSRTDFAGEIKAATGVDCLIENDANSAAYGEFKAGAGRGAEDLFYATLGSGIGGAFILGGKIWRGGSGFAGEFGYVAINSDGMRLEDVASSPNIVRRTRGRFHQDSTSVLSRLDENEITIKEIVEAASKEDDFAMLMLERTGVYIGSAIATVINLLNIERIVLGGEIMKAGPVILEGITRRAKELSFGPAFANTQIIAGTLGENAAAIGAALLAAEL